MRGSSAQRVGEVEEVVAVAPSSDVVASTVRLTILAQRLRVDLAVPNDTSVAELTATIVAGLGTATADQGVDQGGWALQRLGQAPLDAALSLATLQVRDGETLRLAPQSGQLAELAYDDVLDAVASGVNATPRWLPAHTRRALVISASAALAFTMLSAILSGPQWLIPAILLGTLSGVLLLAAGLFARTAAQPRSGLLAGVLAVVAAAGAAGGGTGGNERVWQFGAEQGLPGAAAVVLVSVLAMVITGTGVAVFVGLIVAGLLGVIGTGAVNISSLSPAATGALVAGVALMLSPFLAIFAFRASRLELPLVPASADDLRRDTGTVDSIAVLRQAGRADQFLTGLVSGIAAAVGVAAILLVSSDTTGQILAGVLGMILLLRGRLYTGRGQRGALLIAGVVVLIALATSVAIELSPTARLLALAIPAVLIAAVVFVLSEWLPARRLAPPWGRGADLLETALVLAVVPLVLAVMGVYGAIRDLTS
jgi:type VII secretion integral membrane protein EccD